MKTISSILVLCALASCAPFTTGITLKHEVAKKPVPVKALEVPKE